MTERWRWFSPTQTACTHEREKTVRSENAPLLGIVLHSIGSPLTRRLFGTVLSTSRKQIKTTTLALIIPCFVCLVSDIQFVNHIAKFRTGG